MRVSVSVSVRVRVRVRVRVGAKEKTSNLVFVSSSDIEFLPGPRLMAFQR